MCLSISRDCVILFLLCCFLSGRFAQLGRLSYALLRIFEVIRALRYARSMERMDLFFQILVFVLDGGLTILRDHPQVVP